MKNYFTAFCMCQSMFCALPFPFPIWEESVRDKMLPVLPLLGLELGFIWFFVGWIGSVLGLPALIQGLLLALCPFFLTGGIHLDGFMDVTDAVGSCRDLERRREILKDSHVGSFAVIGLAMLLLSQFAACSSIHGDLRMLILIPAVSRCCSALAVLSLPPMNSSQYAKQSLSHSNLILPIVLLVVYLAVGACFGRRFFTLPAVIICYLLALRHGYRSLQGMNGDIAGYALCLSELAGVLTLAIL